MTEPVPPARPARILASTNSHKREPLRPTLEVFSRLGLRDIDLNLHHLVELGMTVAEVKSAVEAHGVRLLMLSGGWCDFYHPPPDIERTMASVARQAAMCGELGVQQLRLFFGRLEYVHYTRASLEAIAGNLSRVSDAHPGIVFAMENHDGASLHPEVCAEILGRVARPNIVMNFDPINFARGGTDPMNALRSVRPFIGHVHLKGLERGGYCEFGEGDVDLGPVIHSLLDGGYAGRFTVEYEGPFDGTVRLYRSVGRARAAISETSR